MFIRSLLSLILSLAKPKLPIDFWGSHVVVKLSALKKGGTNRILFPQFGGNE